jgi:hypothetical protein
VKQGIKGFQPFIRVPMPTSAVVELDAEALERGVLVPARICIFCPSCRNVLNGARVAAHGPKTKRPSAVVCSSCGDTHQIHYWEDKMEP